MATEAAFEGAGAKPGLEIWRIEAMAPVPVPEAYYGQFYSGDSYILLATIEAGSSYDYNLHFWLGAETTQDESTVAAYKAVELDTQLGDKPIQYREVEGHESTLFSSYFKKYGGLQYLEGGVASGFNHVEPDSYEPRLLHIKGKRNARTKQVSLAASSLNDGDVFLLDLGLKLFLWTGSSANQYEKGKGAQVLTTIRNTRGARPEIILLADEPDNAEFWSALGGSASDVQPAGDGGDDADAVALGEPTLYRVSNASGSLEVTEVPLQKDLPSEWEELTDDETGNKYYYNSTSEETVWERPEGDADAPGKLVKSMLDTTDVFILDCETELYVWIGKGANADERKDGMKSAQEFITTHDRPSWTRVTRIAEKAETPLFKSKFFQWDPPRTFDFTSRRSTGVAAAAEEKEIDASDLHKGNPESEQLVDDGSGEVKIYRITGTEMLEHPADKAGQFFAGDSYVVHYQYDSGSGLAHLIYFWLGRNSSTIEKGSAAARTVELTESLGNADVTQIRVVQGKEPPHFCALFKGSMIVHSDGVGGEASHEGLFHVKGSTDINTKAVQVEAAAASLNSGDCFVLLTDSTTTLWYGNGASESEKSTAASIAEILKGEEELTVYQEGGEGEEWWEALGGQAEYPTSIPLPGAPEEPRLFHVSDVTGAIRVEEIYNFSQEDLIDEDALLLDTYNQVFVWVGSKASAREKSESIDIAQKYIDAATDGRDPDTPIIRVNAGREPKLFTCNFQAWEKASAGFVDPYEARMAALRAEKERQEAERDAADAAAAAAAAAAAPAPAPAPAPAAEEASSGAGAGAAPEEAEPAAPAKPAPSPGQYTYEVLKGARRGDLDIDFSAKPDYLADGEFEEVMGMTRADYNALPKWKQTNKKKEVGLF